MKGALLVLLAVWAAMVQPARADTIFMKGNELLTYCEVEAGSFESGVCFGYITGIADALSSDAVNL